MGLLLLDLSKAFDCLPHSLIIAKVSAYGASTKAANLLADYLTNRQQRVKVTGAASDWCDILKGVPQGSILGPTFFNIFINDVFLAMKEGTLFNYADDNTALVTGSTDADVVLKMTRIGSDLINWCKENQMEANASKFQALIANEKGTTELVIEGNTIVSEPCVKLLGVTIDNKLSFNNQIDSLIKRASRQLNCLIRFSRTLHSNVKLLLYKSFIMSNFNFCPVVWHHCGAVNSTKLEKLQFRALKFIYRDFNSDYDVLLARANLPTLKVARLRTLALEVFKAVNKLSPTFIQDLFAKTEHKYNLRAGDTLTRRHVNTTKGGKHSFSHYSTQIWNDLPNKLRSTSDYKVFKKLIQTWEGPACKCSLCRS